MYKPSVITNVYNKPSVNQVAFDLDLTNTNPNSIVFEFKDRLSIALTKLSVIITSPTESVTLSIASIDIHDILVATRDDYVELYFNLKSNGICKVDVKCDTTNTSDVNLSYVFDTDHHPDDLNDIVTYHTETEYVSQLHTETDKYRNYSYTKVRSSKILNSEFRDGVSSLPDTPDKITLKEFLNYIIKTGAFSDLSAIACRRDTVTSNVELNNKLTSIYNNLFIDTVGYNLTGYSLFKRISKTVQSIDDLAELLDYEIKDK